MYAPMYSRLTLSCALTVLLALLLASRLSLQAHPEGAVRPSRVERLTNLEVSATNPANLHISRRSGADGWPSRDSML